MEEYHLCGGAHGETTINLDLISIILLCVLTPPIPVKYINGAAGFTYTLLSVSDIESASLDMLCCSLSLALVAGARA